MRPGEVKRRAAENSGRGNMNEPSEESRKESEHESKEWLKDYLRKVYGVKMSGAYTIQKELSESGQHIASSLVADEFVFRLLARFNDLDIAPCDGYISMAELEYGINSPRLYFDVEDMLMLKILKRYFQTIKEICAQENDNEMSHEGISRHDLEILSTSKSKHCAALRKRLKDEFYPKMDTEQ
jgi:hypothetical protein